MSKSKSRPLHIIANHLHFSPAIAKKARIKQTACGRMLNSRAIVASALLALLLLSRMPAGAAKKQKRRAAADAPTLELEATAAPRALPSADAFAEPPPPPPPRPLPSPPAPPEPEADAAKPPPQAPPQSPEEADRAFLAWVRANGGEAKVELKAVNGVRGAFATQRIPQGTAIAKIPMRLAIW